MKLETIFQYVTEGKTSDVESGVQEALDAGVSADEILNQALIAAMDKVGQLFEDGDLFVPEMLIAARAMQAGLNLLKPSLAEEGVETAGTVAVGTVKGDLHDIGKNLVAMMMESAGLTVHNLGVDIAPEEFVKQIKEKNANILCMSALLTTTMPMMKQTIDAIVESGLRDQVKIMIGGAPVTQGYADDIGADAMAPDAGSAAKKAKAIAA